MKKKTGKTRTLYSSEFKERAIKLAKELGSTRQAADKLGIGHFSTLSLWIRQAKKSDLNPDAFDELQKAKEEIKKLKKELEKERKSVTILRDATAFFCLQKEDMRGSSQ